MVKTEGLITGSGLVKLPETARRLLELANDGKIWLFKGDMGSGKTTLIKEMAKILGVNEPVSSPTFSIVNEYLSNEGPIYHFDFYRIKTLAEALDAGVEDFFFYRQLLLH